MVARVRYFRNKHIDHGSDYVDELEQDEYERDTARNLTMVKDYLVGSINRPSRYTLIQEMELKYQDKINEKGENGVVPPTSLGLARLLKEELGNARAGGPIFWEEDWPQAVKEAMKVRAPAMGT